MKHFVMGTAGHTGHGKTSLIRALTGHPPEPPGKRVEYARMRFDETLLDIVDPPAGGGMEAVLPGVADADMALLAVAADEGVMSQTLEHLRILSLLDVSRCIVVLTKIDQADAEMLELAREEVRGLYNAWGLPVGTPVVEVSAHTGEGMERLLETIVEQCARMPVRRHDRPFYMHVSSLAQRSDGLIAAGTVKEGMVRAGEEIALCPGGEIARVCALQSGGKPLEWAEAGQRVSLQLDTPDGCGIGSSALSAVLPTVPMAAGPMDVRLIVLPESEASVKHGERVRLYVGTASVACRISLPKEGQLAPGQSGYGQLVPEIPLPALSGERFILQMETSGGLAGGGMILDARAPLLEKEGWRSASARMSCYEYGGKDGRLHWEASARPCTEPMLRGRFARWSDGEFRRTRDALLAKGLLIRAGDLLLGAQLAGALKGELIGELTRYHAQNPLEQGMPLEIARHICPAGLLELCIRDGTVKASEFCVSLPLFDPRKTRRFWQIASMLMELSRQIGPLNRDELVECSGLPEREAELALLLLEQEGWLDLPESGRQIGWVGIG